MQATVGRGYRPECQFLSLYAIAAFCILLGRNLLLGGLKDSSELGRAGFRLRVAHTSDSTQVIWKRFRVFNQNQR